MTRYYSIPKKLLLLHIKISAFMGHKLTKLCKGLRIKQSGHPFKCCQISFSSMYFLLFFSTSERMFNPFITKFFEIHDLISIKAVLKNFKPCDNDGRFYINMAIYATDL